MKLLTCRSIIHTQTVLKTVMLYVIYHVLYFKWMQFQHISMLMWVSFHLKTLFLIFMVTIHSTTIFLKLNNFLWYWMGCVPSSSLPPPPKKKKEWATHFSTIIEKLTNLTYSYILLIETNKGRWSASFLLKLMYTTYFFIVL